MFHNANLFGSCIIHILYTGCAEIKIKNFGAKGLMKLNFSMDSAQIFKYQNSCKFTVGSKLFHTDLQTDMMDLTVV
jgi:hypothetical protein